MDRENIKVKLTEEQKKAKRKKYMREYYLRRNYNMVNGEYKQYKPKKKSEEGKFSIIRKEIIVSFT